MCCWLQVLGGRYFYVASWKALRHGTMNMDVLVVLATSVAFLYSIAVLLAAIIFGYVLILTSNLCLPPQGRLLTCCVDVQGSSVNM